MWSYRKNDRLGLTYVKKKQDIPEMEPYKRGLIRSPRGGYEWKNHKYIDKVKTKSGKWRYIYEDKNGNITAISRRQLEDYQFKDKDREGYKEYARNKVRYYSQFITKELINSIVSPDNKRYYSKSAKQDIKATAHYSLEYVKTEASDVINAGKNFLKNLFK